MLRAVTLPDGTPGHLFLSAMPGLYRPFAEERQTITDSGVDTVICLTPLAEIRRKSPDYAAAIHAGSLPWRAWHFPVQDFDVPDDREAFLRLARDAAARLQNGERVLIHCAAGIGRTGMTATCVLMALGLTQEAALSAVYAAGSGSEDPAQQGLIRWAAGRLG